MAWSGYGRFMGTLLAGKLGGGPHPLTVNLHITGQCDARCHYCYGDYGQPEAGEMGLVEIRRLLGEIRGCGGVFIQLGGGEPLLHRDLPAILAHCRRLGLIPVISTNGRLVPERLPELSAAAGLFISIDGDAAANDQVRGAGSYAAAVRALAACRNARMPATINSVFTRQTATVATLDHLVGLAREHAAGLKFHFLFAGRRGEPPAELTPRPDQYAAVLARLQELSAAGAPITYSPRAYALARAWQARHPCYLVGGEPEVATARCAAGRYMCMIDADGRLYPCAQGLAFFSPRNALVEGFRPAWRHLVGRNPCRGCGAPQYIEWNLLFAGDPAVIRRQAALAWKRWRWRRAGPRAPRE